MDLYALRHSVIHCLKFKVCLSLCTSIVIRLHEQKAGIKDIQKLSAERFGETTKQLLISYEPFYYLLSVSVAAYAIALVLEIAQLMKSGEVVRLKIGSDAL